MKKWPPTIRTSRSPNGISAPHTQTAGDARRALEARIKALELEGGGEFTVRLREAERAGGIDAANRFWFDESIKAKETGEISSTGRKQTGGLPAMAIAIRAATVKDRERTLHWLERALAESEATLSRIKYVEKFDFVRDDPRFRFVESESSF